MEEIIVVIAPDGQISIEVNGVKGPSCTQATKFLEEALGKPVGQTLKREYFESPLLVNKIGGGK